MKIVHKIIFDLLFYLLFLALTQDREINPRLGLGRSGIGHSSAANLLYDFG